MASSRPASSPASLVLLFLWVPLGICLRGTQCASSGAFTKSDEHCSFVLLLPNLLYMHLKILMLQIVSFIQTIFMEILLIKSLWAEE